MMVEFAYKGVTYRIPTKTITRVGVCPKRMLDNLPLSEIEEYVKGRKRTDLTYDDIFKDDPGGC